MDYILEEKLMAVVKENKSKKPVKSANGSIGRKVTIIVGLRLRTL